MEATKTVTLFHDLSSYGRCALSVIIPVVSALGVQAIPVPTALLSTHTGGFKGYSSVDLTEELTKILEHHDAEGIYPDGIYSGYLCGIKQIEIINEYIMAKKQNKGAYVVIDPVMADDGRLYSAYGMEYVEKMRTFIQSADLITPNITEAHFLLGIEYKAPPYTEEYIRDVLQKLSGYGGYRAVVTSVELDGGGKNFGAAFLDRGKVKYVLSEKLRLNYPGSGDIYASILTSLILSGKTLEEACIRGAKFLERVISHTIKSNTPVRNGLIFEKFLKEI